MSITPTRQPIIPRMKRETIIKLLKKGERIDGRGLEDYRKIDVVLNPIPKADGSALVKLGHTATLTGIKLEIEAPFKDRPYEGVLQIHAEFVPLASPTFEPGPPDEEAIEVARVIDRSLREPRVIKLEELVIVPERYAWAVYTDLYLLDHDGNIIDAGMLSTILALNSTMMYEARVEGDKLVVDKTSRARPLPINLNVVTVTIGVYEDYLVVDPCLDEELVLESKITFAVDEHGRVVGLQRVGLKGLKSTMFDKALDLALKKAGELHAFVKKVLNNPQDFMKSSLVIEGFWER